MPWLLPLLAKLAWWLLPKLLGNVVDSIAATLSLVEKAELAVEGTAARRDWVIQRMPATGLIPEWALRVLLEFCVILHGLGVTYAQLKKMEELVSADNIQGLLSSEKRALVLNEFKALFPELPERIGRLLLEIAVAKVKAALSKGAA